MLLVIVVYTHVLELGRIEAMALLAFKDWSGTTLAYLSSLTVEAQLNHVFSLPQACSLANFTDGIHSSKT